MAKPLKPSDFYGPESHICLWNCMGCGDVNVGLCQEGEMNKRTPSKFSAGILKPTIKILVHDREK